MSVRFRKDRKKWETSVRIGGKRQRISTETKKAGEELAQAVRMKRLGVESHYGIHQAFTDFIETESAQKIAKTAANDKRVLELADHFFYERGLRFVEQIQLEDLQAFQLWLKKSTQWGQTTTARNCKIIKAVFRKLMQTRRILNNPAEYWKVPPGENKQRRPMTHAEFSRLFEFVPLWFVPILHTLRLTGARGASLATLTWGDIDFQRATLSLRSRKGGLKKMKIILIPIFPELQNLLTDLWNRRHPADLNVSARIILNDSHVFLDDLGRPVTAAQISSIGSRAIRAAGIEGTTLYGLRNALATDLLNEGVSTDVIRRILGHSSEKQLQVYTGHASLAPLQEALESVRKKEDED